jgi:hypothetical protein
MKLLIVECSNFAIKSCVHHSDEAGVLSLISKKKSISITMEAAGLEYHRGVQHQNSEVLISKGHVSK